MRILIVKPSNDASSFMWVIFDDILNIAQSLPSHSLIERRLLNDLISILWHEVWKHNFIRCFKLLNELLFIIFYIDFSHFKQIIKILNYFSFQFYAFIKLWHLLNRSVCPNSWNWTFKPNSWLFIRHILSSCG